MYHLVTNCRACNFGPAITAPGTKTAGNADRLQPVFSLGVQPLANDFRTESEERAGFAPLEVLLCPRCGLAQLSIVVRPEILYANYPYVTSKSQMMQEHFKRLWDDCSKLTTCKTVLEIGSNDGDFLAYCAANGAESVQGIEPSENLVATARKHGVMTLHAFFGSEAADVALQIMPKVGIIFARHVFCHVDDWDAFMRALQLVADKDTVVCIEVPYVMDQLEANSFDQIYHEHLSYLSIRAVRALLDSGPFHLRKILHYPIHGGAIVLVIQRRSSEIEPDESVSRYLSAEDITYQTWKQFGARCRVQIDELSRYVRQLADNGKRVVGYGASAKSTVWINACGFTKKEISCVYDCTPEKWYRYIPGTDIPVVHEGGFYVDNPDFAVLFAWNFAAECLSKQRKWLEGGGKFIVPVPSLRVIGIDSVNGKA